MARSARGKREIDSPDPILRTTRLIEVSQFPEFSPPEADSVLQEGTEMKYTNLLVLALCAFVVTPVFAQSVEEIEGYGTPGHIPVFTGSHRVGNSAMFESGGNIGIGTTTPDSTLTVRNFSNSLTSTGIQPQAIYAALQNSTINFSAAIRGDSLPTTGGGIGVIGLAYGDQGSGVNGTAFNPAGNGVVGNNPAATGGGGGGVTGITSSADFGFSYATRGTATASTGSALGIFAEVFSPNGTAGYFLNRGGGNIIVGHTGINDTLSVFRVDSSGRVYADGGFQPNGADFAESVAVTGERSKYAAGDLLVIDANSSRHLTLAQQPYSTLIAGIYSTKPGMLGTTRGVDEPAAKDEVPLAVVGIVPCKVSAENGAIEAGDLLVTSSTPGHAMKGTDRSKMLGAVVGKALEPLQKGTGVIQVLVTLQ